MAPRDILRNLALGRNVRNLTRRIFGFLAIAACSAMMLYLLYVSFMTYVLNAALPSDSGWYWDAWLGCGKLLLAVCAPLLAFIFWSFRVRRAMFAKWILRISGASMLVLSVFGFGYAGLAIAFDGSADAWRWTARALAPQAIALFSVGTWMLVLTRPGRRRQTADLNDGQLGGNR